VAPSERLQAAPDGNLPIKRENKKEQRKQLDASGKAVNRQK
jgi:hypothetical protein